MSSPTDFARLRTVVHASDAIGKIEAGEAIGDDVGQEMERAVEEGEEARHPPEPDDARSSRSAAAAASAPA